MKKKLLPLVKWVSILSIFATTAALSAPYAAIVINADTGEVLLEENADDRMHPAGLTKLMTLYVAFDAIETGLIGLDDPVEISLKAQSEPPVKLGLREGQQIKLRYLLRAAGVQGANDASTALAEAVDGSEAAFARRMNGYATELGLLAALGKMRMASQRKEIYQRQKTLPYYLLLIEGTSQIILISLVELEAMLD